MEASYTTKDGRMTFKFDEKTQADVFERIAEVQEVFENSVCTRNGKSSDDLKYVVREVEGNKFYELVCKSREPELLNARLSFGMHKKGGTLFPKRNEEGEDGKKVWLKNNGWVQYNKDTGKTE